ncbi:MAG: tellurite resistance/C4-dicarboxylate transporter family protein, partial [Hydrogenophaga sp.]|nr:tellurite resistance/C4-dicarboxylate transporter family protein [Hydrogenophaga sp.]
MNSMPEQSRSPSRLAALETMSPAYFGLVMSTGIVSLAANLLDMVLLAQSLFVLNIVFYPVLWVLYALRLKHYRRAMLLDLSDHLRGPGFFTLVAATSLLGSQSLLLADSVPTALAFWVLALLLWVGLTYTFFTLLTVKEHKPPLNEGINGGWLLAVVATQSLAVLSALLAARIGQPGKLELNFFALSMWLWGGMLYIWMISLIFYRYTFFRFSPADLAPPYWINMG